MKKLGYFKKSLLMSAVALSVLSSHANAVSKEVVSTYLVGMCGNDKVESHTLENLAALDDAQWVQFQETAFSLMTKDMRGAQRMRIIKNLVEVAPQDWSKLVSIQKKFLTTDMSEKNRSYLIKAFANIHPARWEQFVSMCEAFMTEGMSGLQRSKVIRAFSRSGVEESTYNATYRLAKETKGKIQLKFWGDDSVDISEYIPATIGMLLDTFQNLPTPIEIEDLTTVLIKNINVHHGVVDDNYFYNYTLISRAIVKRTGLVDSQIQRFMRETKGKIELSREDAVEMLIKTLNAAGTAEQAVAFTTALIERVSGDCKNVKDNELLSHILTAWSRVSNASREELQKLARQGNVSSLDKKEDPKIRRGLASQPGVDEERR